MTSDGQSMSSGDCSSSVPSKSSPSGCSSSDVSSGSLGSNGCAGSSGDQQPQQPQATVASAASVLHRPQGSSKRSSRDERTVLGKSTDLLLKRDICTVKSQFLTLLFCQNVAIYKHRKSPSQWDILELATIGYLFLHKMKISPFFKIFCNCDI